MGAYTKRREISQAVAEQKKAGNSVGFVPTMGTLHNGHASLINYALDHCDHVVVSIYVNPTQFNNASDLKNYPRDLDADLSFLKPYGNKITVFAPDSFEVYGENVVSKNYDFGGLEKEMEGKFRPGHFEGVGTVLKHLFEIVKPDKAFFGEKDFQQLQIVRKLVEIESIPVEIIGCPINRHQDGLAESSRNKRLTKEQLEVAPFIYKMLSKVKEDFNSKEINKINHWVKEQFEAHNNLKLEYFEIADTATLKTISEKQPDAKYRAFIAAFLGDVRLIDNIALN